MLTMPIRFYENLSSKHHRLRIEFLAYEETNPDIVIICDHHPGCA